MEMLTNLYWERYATLAAVALLSAACWKSLPFTKKKKDLACSPPRCFPPKCRESFFRVLTAFNGRQAPFFLLKIARENGGKVVELPLGLPGQHFFLVADYRLARRVLEDPSNLKFLPIYQQLEALTLGENFFGREGNRAKHVRKAVAPFFASSNISQIARVIEECLEYWITGTLDEAVKSKVPIDVAQEMQKITVSVICRAGFGYQLTQNESDMVLQALKCGFEEYFQECAKNPIRKWFWWTFTRGREAKRAAKDLIHLCYRMLAVYKEDSNPPSNTVIGKMLDDPEYSNDEQRVRDLVVFLGAGYDTTSYTLAFILLELARCPVEQIRLRKALRLCKTAQEARNCPELKNVTREALRLHPAVALGGLRVTNADIVHENMYIPKGSTCHIPNLVVQRDESVFTDADSFVPSRWKNPSKEALRAMIPFGLGRRNCPGQSLAVEEINQIIYKLVSEYEFEVEEEGHVEFSVTLKTLGTLLRAKKIG